MKATFLSKTASRAVMLIVVGMIAYGFSLSFAPSSKSSYFSLIKSAHAETQKMASNRSDADDENYERISAEEMKYFLKS